MWLVWLDSPRGRGLLVLVGTATAVLASLVANSARGFPPCLFHALTGLPCASCGMTRAFLDLGHGRILSALQHNLASPLVYLGAWLLMGCAALQVYQGREQIRPCWDRVKPLALPLLLAILGLGWVLRLGRLTGF